MKTVKVNKDNDLKLRKYLEDKTKDDDQMNESSDDVSELEYFTE